VLFFALFLRVRRRFRLGLPTGEVTLPPLYPPSWRS
jgi:hypothetical protein